MKFKLLVLLAFFGISIYLWMPALQNSQELFEEEEPVLVPDFTATLLHQEMFDKNGQIKQEVFSQEMEHYSELALTYFKQPEFVIYQNNQPYWRMSAETGNVQDGLLTLDNKVKMVQLNDNLLVATIDTDYLEIDLNTQIVITDKPITITGRDTVVKGQGMVANLKAQNVTLKNHVQTILKGTKND